MKKSLLLALALLSVHALSAQTKWIIVTGTSYSSFNTDLMALYGFENFRDDYLNAGGTASSPATNSIKVNGYIGIESDITVSEKGLIKTGLKYVSVGDSYFFTTKDIQYKDSYGSKTDAKFIMRPRIDYLAIPVNYGIRQSERFSIYAGVTPHFNVDNLIRYNRFTGNVKDVKEKWERMDNPVNVKKMVLFANLGASYYMSQRALLDLRIHRSLGSVYDDPNVSPTFNEANVWNVELGFGLALGGNKSSSETAQ